MRVTFYGVRGGYPASGAGFAKGGSHTTCVRIDAGGHLIIIDAGTGLARLGRDLIRGNKGERHVDIVLLLTHGHHDHLAGLPHFLPLFSPWAQIHAFGPPSMGTEAALWRMFSSPWFPVRLDELPSRVSSRDLNVAEVIVLEPTGRSKTPRVVRDDELKTELGGPQRGKAAPVIIRAHRCLGHPRDGVYVYRIEHGGASVVMATDVEAPQGGDIELAKFARGADLLIHDAQYTKAQYLEIPAQGFGHSTPQMAGDLAVAAKVKRLILTHHSPENNDETVSKMVGEAKKLFANTDAAFEGTTIELGTTKRRRKAR